MFKSFCWPALIAIYFFSIQSAFGQQDVEFHLNAHLLAGKNILKVKRDFNDPYLWVLAQSNEVYRVNSLTQTVDDYTARFSGYGTLQFTDIAGSCKDTVFIATGSVNVIEYKNGALKLIGAAGGLAGTVNSVGITDTLYNTARDYFPTAPAVLMIGTDSGSYFYNISTEKLTAMFTGKPGKVYDATYRSLFNNNDMLNYDFTDTIQYHSVKADGYYYGFLWTGGSEFGNHINTAVNIPGQLYDHLNVAGEDAFFWGTENGMFQTAASSSYWSYSSTASTRYLYGTKVNKITTILGLTGFGSGHMYGPIGLIRENLLIGTDKGLYFSNSIYESFYHTIFNYGLNLSPFAPLANVVVNDISVNVVSAKEPICEDGAWVAANDGLYLIRPDYAKYLNEQAPHAIGFKDQPDTIGQVAICNGSSVTAKVNVFTKAGVSIQWYRNGIEIPGEGKDSLIVTTEGAYNTVLYDPCGGTRFQSNFLTVTIIPGPVFSFNYPDTIRQCNNTPDTLKTENNAAYRYRWYTDGVLNGETGASYIAVKTGEYKVEVSACAGNWVASKEVRIDFIELPLPVITADKPLYCIGDNAVLSVSSPANPSYTVNWYRDDTLLTASLNQSRLVTNVPGAYSVAVVNNRLNTDGTNCSMTSAGQPVSFAPAPVISIEEIVKTSLCNGQTVDLAAHHTAGDVRWSTGENADRITVNTSGSYKVTITSPAGCQADTAVSVSFLPDPVLALKDTSICIYNRQPVTLTAPAGFSAYMWNGEPGRQTYQVGRPQKVSLAVTDGNGCQSVQEINVTEQCPDMHIPDTFTPNHDGINDTWAIGGVENDPSVVVKVFNRYGVLLFENRGYSMPWNGEYAGRRVPAGVYYYMIAAKNGTQHFSGSVTVLY